MRQCQRLGPACQQDVIALVVRLLLDRRPAHIAWLIPFVVVDPVQAVGGARPFANVSQELRERLSPRRADGDATGAICGVIRPGDILAPIDKSLPCLIFNGLMPAARIAVRQAPLAGCLCLAASATDRLAGAQVIGQRHRLVAAIAHASPGVLSMLEALGRPYHKQPTKPPSSQVNVPVERAAATCRLAFPHVRKPNDPFRSAVASAEPEHNGIEPRADPICANVAQRRPHAEPLPCAILVLLLPHSFELTAAATCLLLPNQHARFGRDDVAAIAETFPEGAGNDAAPGIPQDDKPCEASARQVIYARW